MKNKAIHVSAICALLVLSATSPLRAAGTFDFVIETTQANQAFVFYVKDAVDFNIDWGDGQASSGLSGSANQSHTYAAPGVYTNRVGGTASRIAFGGSGTTPKLLKDITSRLADGVSGIDSAYQMFYGAESITQFTCADWFDAASTNVTSLGWMFRDAKAFNQPIGGWDVGKVTDLTQTFYNAKAFNQDIGGWAVSNVTSLASTFFGATAFNADIGDWDVGKVTQMSYTFYGAKAFNQDIGSWDTGSVTTMGYMFAGASVFNQPIGNWDVGNVTTMASMFSGAYAFDQDIGNWDVGKVTNMTLMFQYARLFNRDIGGWAVTNVATMNQMFQFATLFNRDIGNWDVGNVTTMASMFNNASAFNQDISRWNIAKVSNLTSFLQGGALSTDNYNLLLMRWPLRNPLQSLAFHGGGSKYDLGLPAEGRQSLIDDFHWTITDGGTTGKQYALPGTVMSVK